jgi:hypothetical protein
MSGPLRTTRLRAFGLRRRSARRRFTVLVAATLALAAPGCSESSDLTPRERHELYSAFVQCEEWVRRSLDASPRPTFPRADPGFVTRLGDRRYCVRAYFDVGSGAEAERRPFKCAVGWDGYYRWSFEALQVGDAG